MIYLQHDYIVDKNLDFQSITETWLKPDDQVTVSSLLPPGYMLEWIDRPAGQRGGGVAIYCHSSYQVKNVSSKVYDSFEHIMVTLTIKSSLLWVVVIHWPPISKNPSGHSILS